jgi:hypothetical protein
MIDLKRDILLQQRQSEFVSAEEIAKWLLPNKSLTLVLRWLFETALLQFLHCKQSLLYQDALQLPWLKKKPRGWRI